MLKRQLYIRLFSNLLIPVLGFWVWNWNLYFILLFYLLDLISSEAVIHLKIKKIKDIVQNKGPEIPSRTYGIVSFLFLMLIIAEIHVGITLYHPDIELKQELWAFLSYKELGIPQGFVLIPLVVMMAYTSYKMEFLAPRLYLHQQEKPTWKNHLKERFVLLAFCVILTLFAVAYHFPEWIVLTIILVVTTVYNYLQGVEQIRK